VIAWALLALPLLSVVIGAIARTDSTPAQHRFLEGQSSVGR
jgi:hypothetical protein